MGNPSGHCTLAAPQILSAMASIAMLVITRGYQVPNSHKYHKSHESILNRLKMLDSGDYCTELFKKWCLNVKVPQSCRMYQIDSNLVMFTSPCSLKHQSILKKNVSHQKIGILSMKSLIGNIYESTTPLQPRHSTQFELLLRGDLKMATACRLGSSSDF